MQPPRFSLLPNKYNEKTTPSLSSLKLKSDILTGDCKPRVKVYFVGFVQGCSSRVEKRSKSVLHRTTCWSNLIFRSCRLVAVCHRTSSKYNKTSSLSCPATGAAFSFFFPLPFSSSSSLPHFVSPPRGFSPFHAASRCRLRQQQGFVRGADKCDSHSNSRGTHVAQTNAISGCSAFYYLWVRRWDLGGCCSGGLLH